MLVADDADARLMSPSGVKVDLLFANSGIEPELVEAATTVDLEGALRIPVANITARGYSRKQDLEAKLTSVLREIGRTS